MRGSKKTENSELLELIAWGRAELSRAGIEEVQEECERILMKFLGCSRSGIYLEEHARNISGVHEKFLTVLKKRLQRIPLAYLLKEADFWQETLVVDERCLTPRPETEILVEQILKALGKNAEKTVSFLDIGTGSGAIAVAILRAFKQAQGTLLDISGEALEVARMNIERYGLQDRATLVQGDIFDISGEWFPRPGPLPKGEGVVRGLGKWDLIVSNPPYLSEEDWKGVQEEIKFEPKMALDGGKDGLDFYRRIIAGAKNHLTHGGLLALEVGQGQAGKVSKWLQTAGYDNIQRFNDYLGIERVVTARNLKE